jgi:hypothetical protein
MPDKKCPHCGLWNTTSAMRCDCGYDFKKASVLGYSNLKTANPLAYRFAAGILLLTVAMNALSASSTGGLSDFGKIISFVDLGLAIGLLKLERVARNFAIFRVVAFPVALTLSYLLYWFLGNDIDMTPARASNMLSQWIYCGILIFLLTRKVKSSDSRS